MSTDTNTSAQQVVEVDIDSVLVEREPTVKANANEAGYLTIMGEDAQQQQQQQQQQQKQSGRDARLQLVKTSGGLSPHPFFSDDRVDPTDPDLEFEALGVQNRKGGMYGSKNMRDKEAHLQFSDLHYEIDIGKKKNKSVKKILKGVSGECAPGHVLAIMGASGAGKTTLLNLLAGRLSQSGNGRSSGSVTVNGQKRDYDTFRKYTAYVLQHDVFFAELTVRETITLSALLRLPKTMPLEDKMKRVDEVIAELGLNKCQNTIVGNEVLRGVSGGEKKRCNIGTELVVDPSLIFLDEPTTGLDSFNAQNVMTTLLSLARAGRTVLCTLHQPRSEIYASLDQLLLLSEGYTMYFGEARNATSYFGKLGYTCPETYNPSDYFLDIISYDSRTPDVEKKSKKRIQFLAENFQEPNMLDRCTSTTTATELAYEGSEGKYAASWWTQFKVIYGRSIKVMTREKATNIARIMQALVFSILLGLIWLEEGKNLQGTGVQAVVGAIFFMLINQSFGSTFQIIFVFPIERSIILKERASRTYGAGAYFLAKLIAELPRTVLLNFFFVLITYFMIYLRHDAASFFKFLLAVVMITLCAESIAYVVSAIARDPQQAGALAPVFLVTSILFGGFFIGVDSIPVWLSWLKYISYLKYGFAASVQAQFEGVVINPNGCAANVLFCPETGDDVLSYYALDELPYWGNIGVMIAFTLFIRTLAYIFLRRQSPSYDTSI